jgi:hypothetical protein
VSTIVEYLHGTRIYGAAAEVRRRLAASPLSVLIEFRTQVALALLVISTSFGWLLFKHPGSVAEVLSFVAVVVVVGWLVWPRTEICENRLRE